MPAHPTGDRPRYKAGREVRRDQLIEAAIDCLAERGFAATTVADVARTAGLSVGIVNFHFGSKELLLVETLRHLANEYRANWQQALNVAGSDPAERLRAVLICDFNEYVCTPRKLAAWCALGTEAKSRPVYQQYCGAYDVDHHAMLCQMVRAVIDQGYGGLKADTVALAFDAVTDGLWFDPVNTATPEGRAGAINVIQTMLCAFFPRHFDSGGAKG